jgi:hypothetical protein
MLDKIVLIDSDSYSIKKTYNYVSEVSNDLKIHKASIYDSVNNKTVATADGYILKFEKDATNENIKKWCDTYNSKYKKIVLINPKTKTITKTYNNTKEMLSDLKLSYSTSINKCLTDKTNFSHERIFKYENDATPENIKKWCDHYNMVFRKVVLIDPKTEAITKEYVTKEEACKDLKLDGNKLSHCLNGKKNTANNYMLRYKDLVSEENIKNWCDLYNFGSAGQGNFVLIDPKTQSINKKYTQIGMIAKDLNLKKSSIYTSLNEKHSACGNYIIKHEKDATPENIKLWCEKVPWALDGTRLCFGCKKWLNPDDFIGNYCNPCGIIAKKESKSEWQATKDGFFAIMNNQINKRTIKHIIIGKDQPEKEITKEDLVKLYDEQKGLCYYTGIKMEHKQLSNWQCSPERLDDSKTYTLDNLKLICLEFNSYYGKWDKYKFQMLKYLPYKKVDMDKLKELVESAKSQNTTDIHYKETLRGYLMKRLDSAKTHSKAKKRRDNIYAEFSLTFEELLAKIIQQKGRCYYSNIPMTYKPKSHWMCSIERLNNKKGYTNENTVLICIEFNTGDWSAHTNDNDGSSQWSREKFKYLLEHIN